MRLPLTMTVPRATGMLLARMRTSSSSDEVQLDNGAAAELQDLINRHRGPASEMSIETLSRVAKGASPLAMSLFQGRCVRRVTRERDTATQVRGIGIKDDKKLMQVDLGRKV